MLLRRGIRWFYTVGRCDDVSAREATRIGLVYHVVPRAQTVPTAMALAKRLAAGPTRTLSATKRLINHALDVDRQTALSDEAWAQEAIMATEDAQEGVRGFVDRRQSVFHDW